jgi:hypothetical protein
MKGKIMEIVSATWSPGDRGFMVRGSGDTPRIWGYIHWERGGVGYSTSFAQSTLLELFSSELRAVGRLMDMLDKIQDTDPVFVQARFISPLSPSRRGV